MVADYFTVLPFLLLAMAKRCKNCIIRLIVIAIIYNEPTSGLGCAQMCVIAGILNRLKEEL